MVLSRGEENLDGFSSFLGVPSMRRLYGTIIIVVRCRQKNGIIKVFV